MNDFLGEFFGTMILIYLGNGVVANVLLGRTKGHNSGWIVITAGWAFSVMSGVFVARAIGSPGFINPVGPIVGALNQTVRLDQVFTLISAEMLGAFAGAILVWIHYFPHWGQTQDASLKLAVFCTAPAIRHPIANLISEALGTFVLVFVGSAIIEKEVGKGFVAPLGGALVWAIGLSLGGTTGYAINPARDLGPRLAHALLPIPGKGPSDWNYAWIPVAGPFLGAVAAAFMVRWLFAS